MQWKRIGAIALALVLFPVPAFAPVSVDPVAKAQRIIMLANQSSIIANQLTQIQQFTDKLSEIRGQVQHLKDKALGSYHALTSPFTSLISAKTDLVGTGMSWIGNFQGDAAQIANAYRSLSDGVSVRGGWNGLLQTADTVTETGLVGLFANLPAGVGSRAGELFRRQRESADRQRVLDHALADASSTLFEALRKAQDTLDKLRTQTNKSDTALAQANVAATATQSELLAALAQLQAYQGAREAGASYERELARRQELERWARVLRQSDQDLQQAQAEIGALPNTGGREVQFTIHPYYQ
ncbi:MAG: hypothetical protein OXU26_00025 [Acidobacteriota bacterium]|nr:hypothetical protein [Acidobacteriota bacterium]MDE2962274.1 hypothetical protein [Acidobacteriota bacterium]